MTSRHRVPADPERVNVHNAAEVEFWRSRFNCSEHDLVEAASAVGVMTEDVGMHLGEGHRRAGSSRAPIDTLHTIK